MDKRSVLKNFEDLTEVSALINREIGVCVCGDQDNLELDDIMTLGSSCQGAILCTCNPVRILFHTHPEGSASPSPQDIESVAKSNIKEGEYCIGAIENNKPKIVCYDILKLKSEKV